MTQEHTPGPWCAEKSVDNNGFSTGKVWIVMNGLPCAYDFDRWEDALLAATAPDLLKALQGVIDILGRAESNASGNPEFDYVGPRVTAARAAIAKARGVQP